MRRALTVVLARAAVALAVVATGCGQATPESEVVGPEGLDLEALAVPVTSDARPARIEPLADLEGTTLWVGSDRSTTDTVLGAVAIEALDAAGADVEDHLGLDGALLARESLLSGELDLYWEGMGTAWTTFLREPEAPDDIEVLHAQLAARDLEEQGVVWLTPTPADDGRAVAVAPARAGELGVGDLTSMADVLRQRDDLPLCATAAFVTFPADGLVDLEEQLDVDLGDEEVRIYDAEPIYADTASGACAFGAVDRLSGRVPAYGLELLRDDADVFQRNHPAPAVREDVVTAHPELVDLFAALAPALDEATVQGLAQQVEVDGVPPREAARRWLREAGFVA